MNALLISAAATFNLVCSGQSDTIGMSFSGSEKYQKTYRVDLDTARWCEGNCAAVNDIARIEENRIVLKERAEGDAPNDYYEINLINRLTGEHSHTVRNDEPRQKFRVLWKGQCEAAPFTGFSGGVKKF